VAAGLRPIRIRRPVYGWVESRADARMRRRTRALGIFAATSVVTLLGAEFARVWRLGSLPLERSGGTALGESRRSARQLARVVHEGYRVSSTRQNALFNMLVAYVVTFGAARLITYSIRAHGRLGPIRNIRVGSRHVHHFLPGATIAFIAGGVSIATRNDELDRWLAIPFGTGVALVLDESALLLRLEDVYWSEEGVLSVQVGLAASSLLAALAYLARMIRKGEGHVLESDWEAAARAWDDLHALGRT
jgi:hypothetical protein